MSKFTDLALDRVLGLNKSIVIVRKIGRFWPSDVRSVFEQSSEDDQVLYSFFSKFVDYGKGRKGILLDLARAVTERMEYVDDQANYGKSEFWNNPIGVFNRTKDDCDGFAVLICYLARLFGFAPWEVFVWVGQVDTGDGLVGHACVCFYDVGKNEYFPIEGSFFASESWDNFGKVSLSDNVRYYYTDYIFNDLVSFSVRKLVKFDI